MGSCLSWGLTGAAASAGLCRKVNGHAHTVSRPQWPPAAARVPSGQGGRDYRSGTAPIDEICAICPSDFRCHAVAPLTMWSLRANRSLRLIASVGELRGWILVYKFGNWMSDGSAVETSRLSEGNCTDGSHQLCACLFVKGAGTYTRHEIGTSCLQVFSRCNSTACIPSAAVPMIDYWRADNNMSAYTPATQQSSSLITGLRLGFPSLALIHQLA